MVILTADDKMVLNRALRAYISWCNDRACVCAQKTVRAPPGTVKAAFAEADRADQLLKQLEGL